MCVVRSKECSSHEVLILHWVTSTCISISSSVEIPTLTHWVLSIVVRLGKTMRQYLVIGNSFVIYICVHLQKQEMGNQWKLVLQYFQGFILSFLKPKVQRH